MKCSFTSHFPPLLGNADSDIIRYTLYKYRPSDVPESENPSSKRKFSIPSPFKKSPSKKKRPAELMDARPDPRRSSSSPSKNFFSFSRPLFIRRNAWRGKAPKSDGDADSEDTLIMTDAEQIAASKPAAPARAQRRQIDVGSDKGQRPQKRARLACTSSFFEHFSKFDFVCTLSN